MESRSGRLLVKCTRLCLIGHNKLTNDQSLKYGCNKMCGILTLKYALTLVFLFITTSYPGFVFFKRSYFPLGFTSEAALVAVDCLMQSYLNHWNYDNYFLLITWFINLSSRFWFINCRNDILPWETKYRWQNIIEN